jgi:hypothetical protein
MRAGYSRLEGEEAAERSASSSSSCPTWIRAVSIILLASAVACGLIIPIAILFSGASTLANQMSADRLKVHLTRLQNVAENNQGSRAPWTGYNASVDYVEKELRGGCRKKIRGKGCQILFGLQTTPICSCRDSRSRFRRFMRVRRRS